MSYQDKPIIATKGLVGWTVNGRHGPNTTYHVGPYQEVPKGCKYLVDMSKVYESEGIAQAASNIWKRPNLDLMLPDDNVRCLFEGCIGNEGTAAGHPWDGDLASLRSSDSVGVDVYVQILLACGGILVDQWGNNITLGA